MDEALKAQVTDLLHEADGYMIELGSRLPEDVDGDEVVAAPWRSYYRVANALNAALTLLDSEFAPTVKEPAD